MIEREALLRLYDTPDPHDPRRAVHGYDRDHARRTAAIVRAVAPRVGVGEAWLERLAAVALLHDLGRAEMDPALFAAIFRAAESAGLPVRPREFSARYPGADGEAAVDRFVEAARLAFERCGIPVTDEVRDHVAMRIDFRGRLGRMLERHAGALRDAGVVVEPWMERVILFYYYPHLMADQPEEVRRMGMLLVACENFEAMNNARRGRDYYGHPELSMEQVFAALESFRDQGLINRAIVEALACEAASGRLDAVVQEARERPPDLPLPAHERRYLKDLCWAAGETGR